LSAWILPTRILNIGQGEFTEHFERILTRAGSMGRSIGRATPLNPVKAALLGILQGLTEFLPVSSSGHLVLTKSLLGVETKGAGFEVCLHLGTLLAILVHYRRELWQMAVSVVTFRRDEHLGLFLLILLASLPAGVIGVLFESRLEALFGEPRWAAAFLLLTGTVLLLTRFAPTGDRKVGPASGFLVGIAQAIAILPGVSRSGSTISTGIFLRIDRERAARFSFLMVVPALFGAALLTLRKEPPTAAMLPSWLLGTATSFVFGYLALRFILAAVGKGRFEWFGVYCLAVGAAALIFI
jgi:undecaprenyl-diphosphatase